MVAKKSNKRTAKKAPVAPAKVDYYPNRVPFYVALLAVTIILSLAIVTGL
jgi:hypothetical protein